MRDQIQSKVGYYSNVLTGTLKVEILAETQGRMVIRRVGGREFWGGGDTLIVPMDEVKDIEEAFGAGR